MRMFFSRTVLLRTLFFSWYHIITLNAQKWGEGLVAVPGERPSYSNRDIHSLACRQLKPCMQACWEFALLVNRLCPAGSVRGTRGIWNLRLQVLFPLGNPERNLWVRISCSFRGWRLLGDVFRIKTMLILLRENICNFSSWWVSQ